MKTWFEWMDRCYAPPVEEALGTQQEAARLKEKVFAQLHSRPAPAAAPAAQPARPRRLRRMAVLAAAAAMACCVGAGAMAAAGGKACLGSFLARPHTARPQALACRARGWPSPPPITAAR